MTKALTPTEKYKKQRDNANFDYTKIADRLRTVSWGDDSHPTGVVYSVYESSTDREPQSASREQDSLLFI